jgi:hypothetical protein
MKFVIGYFFCTSLIEIINPLLNSANPLNYRLGASLANVLLQSPFLIAAIGLAFRKRWAEYLGFLLLIISTISLAPHIDGAFMTAGRNDSERLIAEKLAAFSISISAVWHGVWAFLLYSNRPLASEVAAP